MHQYEDVVLEQFFYNPMTRFGVRELSRQTCLDTKTIMSYLRDFTRKKLVLKRKEKGSFPYFEANRLSPVYRFEKSHAFIKKIIQTDLIPFLELECKPKVIVLFGSVKKGTYHKQSDIDLFVQSAQKRLDLSRYERVFKHKIRIFYEEDLKKLSPGLLENIYNGEVLSGKLEVL